MDTKVCTGKCGLKKSIDKFSKDNSKQDGIYNQCKDCVSEYCKQRYLEKKESILVQAKIWRDNNKEIRNIKSQKYYASHKEQSKKVKQEYMKRRRKEDPIFRLTCNLRGRIRHALKGIAKNATTMDLVGCSREQLLTHLEKQFIEGMTWGNYGYYGWHVDHIRPCSSFDLSDPAQVKECFHYSNLQPLWAKDNLSKGDKFISD